MRTILDVTHRVRAEFLEMPGLRLKTDQLQRLCGIEPTICQVVLQALVNEHFLCVTPDRHYARVTEGRVFRQQSKRQT
jgi:endonuclease III